MPPETKRLDWTPGPGGTALIGPSGGTLPPVSSALWIPVTVRVAPRMGVPVKGPDYLTR